MPRPDRRFLDTVVAFAWTVLLIALLLWSAVWLISQIYIWLIVLAAIAAATWVAMWWLQRRSDRW